MWLPKILKSLKELWLLALIPDDIEFGAGATLAKWADHGCEVSMLICTDGSKGTWDPNIDKGELITKRKSEQISAAAELKATGKVAFLGEVDGELEISENLRKRLTLFIRKFTT